MKRARKRRQSAEIIYLDIWRHTRTPEYQAHHAARGAVEALADLLDQKPSPSTRADIRAALASIEAYAELQV